MLSRRQFGAIALGGTLALPSREQQKPADYAIDIAPYALEVSPRVTIKTIAYNGQVPGPLLRFREGKPVIVEVRNKTRVDEVVHWHGLLLPSEVDGAMEEGTPPITPGASARYTLTPEPAGFRWYHTHTFAGRDLNRGQYTGLHGFLFIEPRESAGRYDAEEFLALHDWRGQLLGSGDGSMNPVYDVATVNGKVLGYSEPLHVKLGQRVLLHILNSSATEVHWIAFAGHEFEVIALDGNPVPRPRRVPMLRLAPAERVSAVVSMNNPGVWVLGEVRKHVQAAGMGIVVEYAGARGEAAWQQPDRLTWNYSSFAASQQTARIDKSAVEIPLVFKSKFSGHGDLDHWMINGKSFPHTETPVLHEGRRYRLIMRNDSLDDHPVHLHRHVFELCEPDGQRSAFGLMKDTVLVKGNTQAAVEFVADNPGMTLFHCHQQDHMDMGFMMLMRYA